MGPLATLRNYFNAQFEAMKGEVRTQTAHLHELQTDQLAGQELRQGERVADLSRRLDDLEGRIDRLTDAVDELRATNDQLLAVAAKLAEAPVTPS